MNDVAAVCICDRIGDRDDVMEQTNTLFDRGPFRDELTKRATSDQLHSVKWCTVFPAPGLVNGNNARVLEACRDQRLAQEAPLSNVTAGD